MKILKLYCLLACLLPALTSRAQQYTFTYTGTVAHIYNDLGDTGYSVGEAVTFTWRAQG